MNKPRILVFPFDLMSHYLRCLKLTERYSDHEIFFAGSSKYNKFVSDHGFSSFEVENFDAQKVMECAKKFDFSWLNKTDIERVLLSQVKAIRKLQPEVVIGDANPTLKMAAEMCGVKYTALMNGYMSKHYAGVRNVSRTHYSYEYLKKLPPNVAGFITVFAEKAAFKKVHEPFRQLRSNYKLKKITGYLNEMEGDENLICDAPELFPQKKLPGNYKIIGPLEYVSNDEVHDVLEKLNPDKVTICVCMGSSGNWEPLQFLSNEKFSNINIVTAGDEQNVITGSHVISKKFLNLDKLLPRCDLMICHGGNGTIYQAIKHKVFALCLTSHFEQEWNVKRLSELELGKDIYSDPEAEVSTQIEKRITEKMLSSSAPIFSSH